MTETKKKILITGAAGFIGRRLAVLLAEKHAVRCLVRDASRAKGLLPAGVELVAGDMTDAASLQAAVAGADAVVHLAARKGDEPDVVAVNVGGARSLVAACRAAGVRRVVNVGSQASRLPRRGAYGETKAQADEVFAASGLEVTTVMPSLVYGPKDPGAFGKLARVTATAPFVPVIGDGSVRFQPVHVDDLCAVIAGCLAEPKTAGKTYSVGGPESVTLVELIDRIGAALGKKPRRVHLPYWAAMGIARVLGLFLAAPPLSVSNVTGAVQSAPDADYRTVFVELGIEPRPLADGLKDALS
ncbi:MAG: NAD-dependent epimerase/dehydratase family protein [Elusimicrobia bacterium]|nr:NAD-dependent epimerase/dehydratase family protein [Elusimicrobiota bacterium]